MMKKPAKKKHSMASCIWYSWKPYCTCGAKKYNQAIDDYEKSLPNAWEIRKEIIGIGKKVYIKDKKTIVLEFDEDSLHKLVEAIFKRQRGES